MSVLSWGQFRHLLFHVWLELTACEVRALTWRHAQAVTTRFRRGNCKTCKPPSRFESGGTIGLACRFNFGWFIFFPGLSNLHVVLPTPLNSNLSMHHPFLDRFLS